MADQQQTAVALRLSVGRLARRLRQESPGDLTPSQRSALATLDREGALRMSDLAAIERVSPPSMTGIVGRLEERGLVTREANPNDARSTVVSITQRALDLLVAIRALRTAFLTTRLSTMTDDELLTLTRAIDLLNRITEDV
ncbi:MAG: MarR family transcriptional regulator [Acidimicrobiia bacterium]